MKITAPPILTLCLAVLAFSCTKDEYLHYGPGKRPIYISYEDLTDIRSLDPQQEENIGFADTSRNLVFRVEVNKGIHVVDITDETNPVNFTFIKIPGVTHFTLSGMEMTADNGVNLVTLDLSDIDDVAVLDIDKNVLEPILSPPLQYSGFYECVDISKGFVIDWDDEAYMDNGTCRTTL